MNRLRQFCAATILTLALSLTVFPGDMATGIVQPPPPPPASVMDDTNHDVTPTNETGTETSFVNPITGFTLNILQGLLSLF